MLALTSRHCGAAELTWLKMLSRFLGINARVWPVNSDNPGKRVRGQGDEVMFTWWVKESSAGGRRWESRCVKDGVRVGKVTGWASLILCDLRKKTCKVKLHRWEPLKRHLLHVVCMQHLARMCICVLCVRTRGRERRQQQGSVERCCVVISIILAREVQCVEDLLNTLQGKYWATAQFRWLTCFSSCTNTNTANLNAARQNESHLTMTFCINCVIK